MPRMREGFEMTFLGYLFVVMDVQFFLSKVPILLPHPRLPEAFAKMLPQQRETSLSPEPPFAFDGRFAGTRDRPAICQLHNKSC